MPFCGARDDYVTDSRETDDGLAIRRRRECNRCRKRFTTHETIEPDPHGQAGLAREVDRSDPQFLRRHDLPRRLRDRLKGSG